MRGLLTLLWGINPPKEQVRKVLVVCSGELNLCVRMVDHVQQQYPNAQFTYVAPGSYVSFLCLTGCVCTIAELKRRKLRSLLSHRRQQYDVTVLMLSGAPIFRMTKLWALLTNYRVLMIYDELLDFFPCTPRYHSKVLSLLLWRLRENEWRIPIVQMFRRIGPLQGSRSGISSHRLYQKWIEKHEVQEQDSHRMLSEIQSFDYQPRISIITPVYNSDARWLESCIESVRNQSYAHWELCICDDGSTEPHVRRILADFEKLETRIKIEYSPTNQGISAASNEAISLATGEFIGLLDHDDELSPNALYEVVRLLQKHPEADIIYSDEDKLEPDGTRSEPFFKPDWSPEYLLSCMYTSHFTVYRRQQVIGTGGFRTGLDGSQDYDLMLRLVERTKNIFHIAKILYHWRKSPSSAAALAEAKPYSAEATRRALKEHMERRGITASVLDSGRPNYYRVRPKIVGQPLVSIIIFANNDLHALRRCRESIGNKTYYQNYEVIVGDTKSSDMTSKKDLTTPPCKVIRLFEPVNVSRFNNLAAQQAQGSYLVFLNGNTEVIATEWVTAMLEFCQLEEVGAVGAKLCYPQGYIEHAGTVLCAERVGTPSHRYFPQSAPGYFNSLACVRNYSAVSATCMMVRRDIFELAGGFDENIPCVFNDVDFCLRVRQAGFRIVWTPYAELYHHHSPAHSGPLNTKEIDHLKKRWGTSLAHDPYYSPNLTQDYADFRLRS